MLTKWLAWYNFILFSFTYPPNINIWLVLQFSYSRFFNIVDVNYWCIHLHTCPGSSMVNVFITLRHTSHNVYIGPKFEYYLHVRCQIDPRWRDWTPNIASLAWWGASGLEENATWGFCNCRGLLFHFYMCRNVVSTWDTSGFLWMWAWHVAKFEGRIIVLSMSRKPSMVFYWLEENKHFLKNRDSYVFKFEVKKQV